MQFGAEIFRQIAQNWRVCLLCMHFDVQNQDFSAYKVGKKVGKQREKVVFANRSYFIWTEEVYI